MGKKGSGRKRRGRNRNSGSGSGSGGGSKDLAKAGDVGSRVDGGMDTVLDIPAGYELLRMAEVHVVKQRASTHNPAADAAADESAAPGHGTERAADGDADDDDDDDDGEEGGSFESAFVWFGSPQVA